MTATAYYPAIIETDDTGGYSVFFPDLPGCTSVGETIEEAFEGAIEAAALYAEVALERGPIPRPSGLQAAVVDADIRVAAKVLVPVTLPGKTVRTNLTFDSGLLAAIDAISDNRSAFLADAARAELRRRHAAGV
jgi:predicted RNase H-like HicB family nuclease